MSYRTLTIAILAAFLGAMSALLAMPEARRAFVAAVSPQASGTAGTSGKALVGGPFRLIEHTGREVTDKDYLGKPMLVMFGFTSCPDICPSGLQVMSAALDKLGSTSTDVSALFITLDPERDTPQKLADYVHSFHPQIRGLSGPADAVAAAVKAYRVYAKKVPDTGSSGGYTIDHSSFFYVMNRRGEFDTHLPHTVDPDKLAQRLRSVL